MNGGRGVNMWWRCEWQVKVRMYDSGVNGDRGVNAG